MKISRRTQILAIALFLTAIFAIAYYWSIQPKGEGKIPETELIFHGNREIKADYIRFWTDLQANSWSGVETKQEWSFTNNPWLQAQIDVTTLASTTFYAEVLLVSEEVDEGFGFQITYSSQNKVKISGWSWNEESETFTNQVEKQANIAINLEARKINTSQIDFYVNDVLLDSISANILSQKGSLDMDMSNGSQGGFTELNFSFQITENE